MDLTACTDLLQGFYGRVVAQAPEIPTMGHRPPSLALADADGEQGHLTTAPQGSLTRCCCQLSCFSFLNLSFIFFYSKSKICVSVSCSTLSFSNWDTSFSCTKLSNPLPSPQWHEYTEARCWDNTSQAGFVPPGQSIQSAVHSQ